MPGIAAEPALMEAPVGGELRLRLRCTAAAGQGPRAAGPDVLRVWLGRAALARLGDCTRPGMYALLRRILPTARDSGGGGDAAASAAVPVRLCGRREARGEGASTDATANGDLDALLSPSAWQALVPDPASNDAGAIAAELAHPAGRSQLPAIASLSIALQPAPGPVSAGLRSLLPAVLSGRVLVEGCTTPGVHLMGSPLTLDAVHLEPADAPGPPPGWPAACGVVSASTEIHVTARDARPPAPTANLARALQDMAAEGALCLDCPSREGWLRPVAENMGGVSDTAATLVDRILASINTRQVAAVGPLPALPCNIGTVLHGPPGVGKTALITELCRALPTNGSMVLSGSEVFKSEGSLAALSRTVLEAAARRSFCLLVIEDLESVAARASRGHFEATMRLHLCRILDDLAQLSHLHGLFVVGITSLLPLVDPRALSPSRLSGPIGLPVPSPAARVAILSLLSRRLPLECDGPSASRAQLVERVAGRAHAFVGADLLDLCREAAMASVRRHSGANTDASSSGVNLADFERAFAVVKPSVLGSEGRVLAQSCAFADLAGVDDVVAQLRPLLATSPHQIEVFRAFGLRQNRGVIIDGPSGTGKTRLAMALAAESQLNLIVVGATAVRHKVIGKSEELLSRFFDKAKASRPCLLLLDQLEAMVPSLAGSGDATGPARRFQTHFLQELDEALWERPGLEPLVVVATTARLEDVSPAVRRAGRLSDHVHVPLPDEGARRAILRHYLAAMPVEPGLIDPGASLSPLVAQTAGCSGAQLEGICREAAMLALRSDIDAAAVTRAQLMQAAAHALGQQR